MSGSPPSADADVLRLARKRHNSTPTGDERQVQKQRTQRTTLACERCRMKKLRCMGGHPCSACHRAKAECDFGERGWVSQQSSSVTDQRISQLEKTIAELVTCVSRLSNSRQPGSPIQPPADLPSCYPPPGRPFPGSSANMSDPRQDVSALGGARVTPCLESPPLSDAQTIAVPGPSLAAQSDVRLFAQNHGIDKTSEPVRSSSVNPRVSERLESRWAALQHNSAPFPPLMSHPTAWSEEPAKAGPDGGTAQATVGITSYKAQVHLQSEPVSEGIVGEVLARALFALFFRKCHPSFPLLEPYTDLDSNFDHIRSSSPFLFTSILAIAGRYYTGCRRTQPAMLSLPPITVDALEGLADLACAHLGFVLLRKQHQLSDVQAALLLSVWIPRGRGQSADQWMITGLCTRLAYRIGIPDLWSNPAILRLANSINLDANDIREVNSILPQWHTWLIINQYDKSLSLGFGRPQAMPFARPCPQQYLAIVRKLGSSAQVDVTAATYVTCLLELSAIITDLISALRTARLQPTARQDNTQPAATAWTKVSALLSDLNPRLDEWQRQWTWGGSHDALTLGRYTKLATIYGEHARLCLNSLSLNLITANVDYENHQNNVLTPYLARACEAAVSIVQGYVESCGAESIIRYGGDYLVLILGQAALFFVRILTARLDQPLPIDRLVLLHYLKKAIELMEANDLSTTGVCGWMAQLSRDLTRYAGLSLDSGDHSTNASSVAPDPNLQDPEWDFDVCALLDQNMPAGGAGLDVGGYFDFAQSFFPPPSGSAAQDEANFGSFSSAR